MSGNADTFFGGVITGAAIALLISMASCMQQDAATQRQIRTQNSILQGTPADASKKDERSTSSEAGL